MAEAPPALTVTEVTGAVRATLETEFGEVRVRGEITNFREAASGHLYLSLKDERAQLRGVMFKGSAWGLRFQPADGIEVEAEGDLTVYEPRGDLQLLIRRMVPSGMGALMQAFERLKRSLADEGLFDADRKQPLPKFPGTVAVVTSPRGAAVQDLIHNLTRRWPVAAVVVVPVLVQGEGSAASIAEGLDRVDAWGGADVVIVGRGGGSLEDLWAFNEEPVARAIARCRTPVVSAVGHETDTTIADLVADVRAATPSTAAEITVPDQWEVNAAFRAAYERMTRSVRSGIEGRRRAVTGLGRAYGFRRPEEFLRREQQRLDHLSLRLGRAAAAVLLDSRDGACRAQRRLALVHPASRIEQERREVIHRHRLLTRLIADRLSRFGARLREPARALTALDPERVLERGFCMVQDASRGTIVTRASALKSGGAVTLQFHRDRAGAIVGTIEEGGLDLSFEPSRGDEKS